MSHSFSRREFLRRSAAAAGLATGALRADEPKKIAAGDRIRVGVVGIGGRGSANLGGVANAGAEIVALCDIDSNTLAGGLKKFPGAKGYADFRKLLDAEVKNLDGLVVSTPDHTHALPTLWAMKAGLDVYCEKPLAHSVHECRTLISEAKRLKRVTQMGTQIHAGDNYRRVVELVRGGAIGTVKEVHVWVGKVYAPGDRPADKPAVPANISYDLWLGPAPERPFHTAYVPFHWRGWWDFGGGGTADMACHYMDLPHWALGLTYPSKVAAEGPKPHAESCPKWLTATFEHPAVGDRPAVTVTWYNGGNKPKQLSEPGMPNWGDGVLFVGSKGYLAANYGAFKLLPEKQFEGFTPPAKTIAASVGHHKEWLDAIRTRGETTCNFDYSGALAGTVLLANVAFRSGEVLSVNPADGSLPSPGKAAEFLQRQYRAGWTL